MTINQPITHEMNRSAVGLSNVPWKMRDGTLAIIRPIRPSDEVMMIRFHQSISSDSVHNRYFRTLSLSHRIEHNRLMHICNPTPGDLVLVAEIITSRGEHQIIAIARLSMLSDRNEAELAVIVSDAFQYRGLGTELFRRLIEGAKYRLLDCVYARVLTSNLSMVRLCSNAGMQIPNGSLGGEVMAVLDLGFRKLNRISQ
jgi:acetyltransferase